MLRLDNRRRAPRWNNPLTVECNGFRATVLNLSHDGARLMLEDDSPMLRLRMGLGAHEVSMLAEVVWSEQWGGRRVVGVTFFGMSDHTRAAVRSWLSKQPTPTAA